MAKATLEFDMNDPDDIMAHLRATKSTDMALALWDILYNTKKGIEWGLESKSDISPYDVVDMVYAKIWEKVNERGINLDELIN